MLTFIPIPQIKELMEKHHIDPSKRVAQHKLAQEFVELIHGGEATGQAAAQHQQMFNRKLSVSDLESEKTKSAQETKHAAQSGSLNQSADKFASQTNVDNAPSMRLKLPRSLVVQQPIPRILWSAGMVASKSEGMRLIRQRGCHIGAEPDGKVAMGDALRYRTVDSAAAGEADGKIIGGNMLILRVGKWKHKIIDIVSDEKYAASGLTCPGWKEEAESKAEKESWKNAQRQRQQFLEERRQNKNSAFSVVQEAD